MPIIVLLDGYYTTSTYKLYYQFESTILSPFNILEPSLQFL